MQTSTHCLASVAFQNCCVSFGGALTIPSFIHAKPVPGQCQAVSPAQDIIGTFVAAVVASGCLHGQTYEDTEHPFARMVPGKLYDSNTIFSLLYPKLCTIKVQFLVLFKSTSIFIVAPFSFSCQIVYFSSLFYL